MNLSLCITTYNRYLLTVESFAKVINDPRIDDIVILDDASTDLSFVQLSRKFQHFPHVRVIQQARNRGMSQNKRDAISYARNEWAIILDSDNIIDTDYLDAFYAYISRPKCGTISLGKDKEDIKTIFCPDFAMPKFDYRKYNGNGMGDRYDNTNIAAFIKYDDFNCLMNTCNYIVNRDFYLNAYIYNVKHKASDTIWHNYNHLLAGGNFHVVPAMQYFHRVHNGSGFLIGVEQNMINAEEVRRLIQQL